MSELNYFLNREKIPTKEELDEAFASDGSERTYEGKFSPAEEEQKEKNWRLPGVKIMKKLLI